MGGAVAIDDHFQQAAAATVQFVTEMELVILKEECNCSMEVKTLHKQRSC